MPPKLALLIGLAFVAWMLYRDRGQPVSRALLFPFLWYLSAATRPVGVWFDLWGLPFASGAGLSEDGSPVDRMFYLSLTLAGVYILARRTIDWGRVFRGNGAIFLLLAIMGASTLWSDYPDVTLKRFIKIVGSVIMALVVLTEQDPRAAFTTLIRRCAYIALPMSIVMIRYFREAGLSWDWNGEAVSWVGVATAKNTLGQIAAVGGVYFIWRQLQKPSPRRWFNLDMAYAAMAIYLLKGSDDALSLTSLLVFFLTLGVLLRLGRLQTWPAAAAGFLRLAMAGVFSLLLLAVVHSIVKFEEDSNLGWIITKLGRDITFTGRTIIWEQCYDVAATNPLFGVGYGAFWLGETANIPFSLEKTWNLGQAHNGYVDAYLQLGWLGVATLGLAILASARKLDLAFAEDFEFARLRAAFFTMILFVNITETTFMRSEHHAWFLFLVIAIRVVPWQPILNVEPTPSEASSAPDATTQPVEQNHDRF